ncbi:MAG: Threonylcarbamoyladenosine tRNA methylthiotransferase MtaB [Holosporales bacterium]
MDNKNQVITFGCRLNAYESEVMKNLANEAGLENVLIFNTCAVTAEAERQVRQSIRKLKRENPHATVIVTGCGAQINPDQFLKMDEVDRVIGNEEKMHLEAYSKKDAPRLLVNDIMSIQETASHLVTGFDGKARAFVQVQNGCNHRCTFCTIPFGRGNSRSVPLKDVLDQTCILLEKGYQEVVLTGVDITDYGSDLEGSLSLGKLCKTLLREIPDLKRLRLSSLDSVEMDQDLWDIIEKEDRLMPHLHLSLQAADDMILKRMKRRHLRSDGLYFCKKARNLRPDVVFGADIIAGFPTETDDMFENTRRFIEEADLTYLHVFPYSKRPNTPAARMPQVKGPIIKERASILRAEGDKALERFFKRMQTKTVNVLVESVDDGKIFAKTDHFAPTIVATDKMPTLGSVVSVTITGYTKTHLLSVMS